MSDLIRRECVTTTIREYLKSLLEKGIHDVEITEFNVDIQNIIEKLPAENEWIPADCELPIDSEQRVLVQVSGQPQSNIRLEDALQLACYNAEDGWILEMYPEWEQAHPIAWMPLPEAYGGGGMMEEKHCWNCLYEECCQPWPKEGVCEDWQPDPYEKTHDRRTDRRSIGFLRKR